MKGAAFDVPKEGREHPERRREARAQQHSDQTVKRDFDFSLSLSLGKRV